MQEQLITFDTAKIAKEKGFDLEFCNVGWHGDFGDLKGDSYPFLGTYSFYKSIYCNNKDEHQIQRPTQSLLQKWLREIHNIKVSVMCQPSYKDNNNKTSHWEIMLSSINPYKHLRVEREDEHFNIYEECLEAGLQEGLKLISNEL